MVHNPSGVEMAVKVGLVESGSYGTVQSPQGHIISANLRIQVQLC